MWLNNELKKIYNYLNFFTTPQSPKGDDQRQMRVEFSLLGELKGIAYGKPLATEG